MTTILAILLTLSALLGQAPAPMTSPDVAPVEQAPLAQVLGLDWLTYELALSGAVVPEDVAFLLTSDHALNCGARLAQSGLGGCTNWEEDGSILIAVSPELEWTPWGAHILHHELGHAVLNSYDECAVERYAHQFTVNTLWSYPACMPNA